MTGPDSDLWPTISAQPTAWDWQSNAPCVEVTGLATVGASDASLLAAVGRYTIENLILNAVHEIGEWARFDGDRLFPAHPPADQTWSDECRDQGNGAVMVDLCFGDADERPNANPPSSTRDRTDDPHLVARLVHAAAPSRFTYLPGTTIRYEEAGPVVDRRSATNRPTCWRSMWSASTLAAIAAGRQEAVAFIGRDVHAALVSHEADRICRAFHVDGRRPWHLSPPRATLGADPRDPDAPHTQTLTLNIRHLTPNGGRIRRPHLRADAPHRGPSSQRT